MATYQYTWDRNADDIGIVDPSASPIILVGDSIAKGNPYNNDVPWSSQMAFDTIINLAVPGSGINLGNANDFGTVTNNYGLGNFETVILSGCTNDIGYRLGTLNQSTTTVTNALIDKITAFVYEYESQGKNVYVTSVCPVGDPNSYYSGLTPAQVLIDARTVIIALNNALATRLGSRFIDLRPILQDSNGWMKPIYDTHDHVHPDISVDPLLAAAADAVLEARVHPYAYNFTQWGTGSAWATPPGTKNRLTLPWNGYGTWPIFDVADATTTIKVYWYTYDLGVVPDGTEIPWNPAWSHALQDDRGLLIDEDPALGCNGAGWELWYVYLPSEPRPWGLFPDWAQDVYQRGWRPGDLIAGTVAYRQADDPINGGGYGGYIGRGAGELPKRFGIATPAEVQTAITNGTYTLSHAFAAVGVNFNAGPNAVSYPRPLWAAPGTRIEHPNNQPPGSVVNSLDCRLFPEGTRMRLNKTDQQIEAWLTSKGYAGAIRNTAKVIAKTLQVKGFIFAETGQGEPQLELAPIGPAGPGFTWESTAEWAALGLTDETQTRNLLDGLITADALQIVQPEAAVAYVEVLPVVTVISVNEWRTDQTPSSINVTGGNFNTSGVNSVKLGGTECGFFVTSDASMTVLPPVKSPGTYYLVVYGADGNSGQISAAQIIVTSIPTSQPAINSISPNAGLTDGSTIVTIIGSGFIGTTSVAFGNTAALSFTVNSDTRITATAPARAAGSVNVVVTNPSGASVTGANTQFNYIATPTGPERFVFVPSTIQPNGTAAWYARFTTSQNQNPVANGSSYVGFRVNFYPPQAQLPPLVGGSGAPAYGNAVNFRYRYVDSGVPGAWSQYINSSYAYHDLPLSQVWQTSRVVEFQGTVSYGPYVGYAYTWLNVFGATSPESNFYYGALTIGDPASALSGIAESFSLSPTTVLPGGTINYTVTYTANSAAINLRPSLELTDPAATWGAWEYKVQYKTNQWIAGSLGADPGYEMSDAEVWSGNATIQFRGTITAPNTTGTFNVLAKIAGSGGQEAVLGQATITVGSPSPAALAATPASLVVTGVPGGTPSPATQVFTITNNGGTAATITGAVSTVTGAALTTPPGFVGSVIQPGGTATVTLTLPAMPSVSGGGAVQISYE